MSDFEKCEPSDDFKKKFHDAVYGNNKEKLEAYRDKVFLYYDLECDNLLIDVLCDDEGNENQYFVDLLDSIIFKHFNLGDSPNNCAMRLAKEPWFG